MQKISLSDIKHTLREFFETQCGDLIIVIDHTERMLSPAGTFSDPDVRELIGIIANAANSKIILTSRRPVNMAFLSKDAQYPDPQPPVGRFPEGPPHVEQLLGAFVGLKTYPPELIEAIDRHPMLGVLAGLYLRRVGPQAMYDSDLIQELRNNMRSAIFSRIIDDSSRAAILAVSRLRISVPRNMIVALSSDTSVRAAEDLGLLFSDRDMSRSDLMRCVGALRLRPSSLNAESEEGIDGEQHSAPDTSEIVIQGRIAELYGQLYRTDDDPKWLREAYYHRMLTRDSHALRLFGTSFRSEIFGAGEYWFRYRKDFASALWAFNTAQKYGDTGVLVRMRRASCLMRVNRQQEGEKEFKKLLEEFPEAAGVKTSFVDGLLFLKEFDRALTQLKDFRFTVGDSGWVAGQFGRSYLGLHLYHEAIAAFSQQLALEKEPIVYQSLARAYHRLGVTPQEKRVLEQGLQHFPHSRRLQLAYAAVLERIGKVDDAARQLLNLLEEDPYDGWVIFSSIKALGRLDQVDRAQEIWRVGQRRLHPEFLRPKIEAAIEIELDHFERALMILEQQNAEEDEHTAGQKVEVYFRWATNLQDPASRKTIAAKGLNELKDLFSSKLGRNIPLLLSYAKLAVVAEDQAFYKRIKARVLEMSPTITEISKIEAEMKLPWE